MIKVDVISGFLGAGKTTLIKKLFESSLKDEHVVLIENEFGEIGIDGSFLKDAGIDIKEINSGCICCSLVGDFAASIKEVIARFNPSRIIIEPSGVGKLSDIVNAIENVDADLTLNILATVVDGTKAKIYMKNFGEFFNNQVETANTIIVSKTDKMQEDKILTVVDQLKEKNEHALIITTAINLLDSNKLLETLEKSVSLRQELYEQMMEEHHHHEHHHDEEECCCGHHHHDEDGDEDECCCGHHHDHEHHHHADEVFVSWGKETPLSFSYEQLEKFLNELSNNEEVGMVLRSKGILKASDNDSWYYFDYVAGDYDIRLGEPDVTGRICVIGSKLDTKKIEQLFSER